MFKKQTDFVSEYLDAIEEFLGPDDPDVLIIKFDENNAIRDNQNGQISLIIDNETFDIDKDEIDSFIVVTNTINNISIVELKLITAKGLDHGLTMGALNFKTTMFPYPSLIVTIGEQKWTFDCGGKVKELPDWREGLMTIGKPFGKLHNHAKLEKKFDLGDEHVIVDRKDWEELLGLHNPDSDKEEST